MYLHACPRTWISGIIQHSGRPHVTVIGMADTATASKKYCCGGSKGSYRRAEIRLTACGHTAWAYSPMQTPPLKVYPVPHVQVKPVEGATASVQLPPAVTRPPAPQGLGLHSSPSAVEGHVCQTGPRTRTCTAPPGVKGPRCCMQWQDASAVRAWAMQCWA